MSPAGAYSLQRPPCDNFGVYRSSPGWAVAFNPMNKMAAPAGAAENPMVPPLMFVSVFMMLPPKLGILSGRPTGASHLNNARAVPQKTGRIGLFLLRNAQKLRNQPVAWRIPCAIPTQVRRPLVNTPQTPKRVPRAPPLQMASAPGSPGLWVALPHRW